MDRSGSLVSEVQSLLEELRPREDNAAFNFVNAIEDLLWAFEKRATASWILQLAIKTNIYRSNVFRCFISFFFLLKILQSYFVGTKKILTHNFVALRRETGGLIFARCLVELHLSVSHYGLIKCK
jgi:hypothetical protein